MGLDFFAMALVMDHDHDLHSSSPPSSKKAAADIVVPDGLPAGYRFRPTDMELVKHYLMAKAFNPTSPLPAFIGVDIDAVEYCNMPPSDLVAVAGSGPEDREWFFFVHLDLESVSDQNLEGMTTKRAGKKGIGFWKLGLKKTIFDSTEVPLAYKSELTYYLASTPSSRQRKTHWKLDEYRLHSPLNLRVGNILKGVVGD
ncbi:NAC domain-containing protein 101 [Linum grandiflorum]